MPDRSLTAFLGTTLPSRLMAALLLLLLAGGAWFFLSRPPLPARSAPLVARLELASGQVLLKHDGDLEAVFSGTALTQDATLETRPGARALLRLASGAAVFLRGGSQLSLAEGGLSLKQGELWVDAPPAERTPTTYTLGKVAVSASDAGLNLKLAQQEGQNTVTVYVARGSAVITSPGGRVEAQAGEQAQVSGDAQPTLSPVAFWDDWTGGMGDHPAASALSGSGAGTLYGVDFRGTPGASAQPLEVSRQAVNTVIRQSFAETEVDQTFFNPGELPVEGWYWFTLPPGATVTGFALETDGVLVEGELIERREAAAQYAAAKASGHAPALLEWIDARTYRARIFPVPQGGSRRVVVRYLELLPLVGGRLRYVYPLQTPKPVRIGEFSLTVDLGDDGTRMDLSTLAEARVEAGGRRVTVRRSGYTPRADFQLEGIPRKSSPPVTVSRTAIGDGSADYLMMRYTPEVDWSAFKPAPGQVVVVVDTSAAGDDANRALKASAAEAILRALSEEDQFALVSLDVEAQVVHPEGPSTPGGTTAPESRLSKATDAEISRALEHLADRTSGGATDLSLLFGRPLELLHGFDQPAIVYVGDGIATSGELASERLIERLRSTLASSRARLFTVGVGSDANSTLLTELARAGGGQAYRIDAPEQATEQALQLIASLKAPTLTELDIDFGAGLDEVFLSANGKVTRGDEVILLARTHNDLPRSVKVKGRIGSTAFEQEHAIRLDQSQAAGLVPRLWAAEFIRRLAGSADAPEQVRGKITNMGLSYGLMTPYTSFLALESEAAYQQQGIQRRYSPLRGGRLALLSGEAPAVMTAQQNADLERSPLQDALREGAGVLLATTAIGCSAQEPPAYEEVAVRQSSQEVYRQEAKSAPMPAEPGGGYAGGAPPAAMNAADAVAAPAAMPAAPPAPALEGAMREDARSLDAPAAMEPQGADLGASNSPAGGAAATGARGKGDASSLKDELAPMKEKRADVSSTLVPARKNEARPISGACSDLSERPLTERSVLWKQRLKTASTAAELLDRLQAARRACELADWRAEALFYRLMHRRIQDEGTAVTVLTALSPEPESQRYLARLILRRAVDVRLVAAVERVLFGTTIDWAREELALSALSDPEARLSALKALLVRSPEDPEGLIRLVRYQAEAGKKEEALQTGRKLTELGMMTPAIARDLGDILALQGLSDDAIRAYSEIVEFDSSNPVSRRMLGDIFLANAWYAPAYRQYKLLTDANPQDSLTWLRLASAAAGEGRVDEALRIERSVAEKEGTPGPDDPRRFARLLSAARLARLLASPPEKGNGPGGDELERMVSRKLKELQLFRGPGTLVLLTWEDLQADLSLALNMGGRDSGAGERVDASPAGLASLLLPPAEAQGAAFLAVARSEPLARPLTVKRHELVFDGKGFKVSVKDVVMPARAIRTEL